MESLRADDTEVWVASQNVPLVRFADRVQSIGSTGLDLLGIPGRNPPAPVLERLAGFDSIVSWYGANRPEFRAAVARFPVRFLPALPDESAGVHAADFFLEQAGQASGGAIPRIRCPRGHGDFVIIHPFSGSPRKNWPLERYRDLAGALPLPVKWCAGPSEALEDAVRFDNLYNLACWIAQARVYIGNDSGISHLAAAAGAPVVALFGPTDPAVWAPRGRQVRILVAQPIESIPVERALAAVEEII